MPVATNCCIRLAQESPDSTSWARAQIVHLARTQPDLESRAAAGLGVCRRPDRQDGTLRASRATPAGGPAQYQTGPEC